MQKAQKKPILYLDSAPCHVSSSTTEFMDDLNFEYSYIPPRLTSLLQPADVCWLKSFKKCYYEKWTQWFLNDSKSFTKSGNLRSPGYAKAIGCGPIDEYLETNDGENDIDGFDNHCETDDEVNDQDDDEEEITEDEGLDEDEVESSNDSIDGIVESNVEYESLKMNQ
ncbi:unnamed protein product [Brachionus calyciflorus]|uniref:DDE-1 domain-containing protein n=1 Tax=Brachionus calyciflorus TaxID=104777 RepID=A0A814PMK2_9BILA|nr:unnamed protein product [Brachionus calyciflorus]